MSDGFPVFPYRQYTTRRNSTASQGTSTELQLFSPSAAAGPMIPSPVASVAHSRVPSVIYSPYSTPPATPPPPPSPTGSPTIVPATPSRATSPSPNSIVIEEIALPAPSHSGNDGRTSSPSPSPSSSSSASTTQVASTASATPQFRTIRRVRSSGPFYDRREARRRASMKQAAEKGRPQRYGVTRDARVAHMQENGRVRIGKEKELGCGCVIL